MQIDDELNITPFTKQAMMLVSIMQNRVRVSELGKGEYNARQVEEHNHTSAGITITMTESYRTSR